MNLVKMGMLGSLVLGLMLAGCDERQEVQPQAPVAFHADDECHVCGMVIADFPGPKGEAVGSGKVRKFCSAAEMFGWWLQPENNKPGLRLYVHDMGRSQWETPSDEHLIDASSAWYVVGPELPGAMGAVLASFSEEHAARTLASQKGGRVLRFEEIDQQVLQEAAAGRMQNNAHQH